MGEYGHVRKLLAERIGGIHFGRDTNVYKFEKIKRAKRQAMERYPDKEMLDFGIGEPDEMADKKIVEVLADAAGQPENRFYADNGILEFKVTAKEYLQKVFGVEDVDPVMEINHVIGAKSGLTLLPYVFINPGDVTIMPSPGYGVLGTHTEYLGGKVYRVPLLEDNGYLPDLRSIPTDVLAQAKLLYLNYPNNPTGATATREFFAEVVDFAKEHNIFVIHDAAYGAIVFDDEEPLSFLSVPGAKEVGVEIHSLSKSFNMTGWRIGFIAGNRLAVQAFANVKDNSDSGQFIAIQKAAIYALQHPEITQAINQKYARRRDQLIAVLTEVGFKARKPKGTFYVYVTAPIGIDGGRKFSTAEELCQFLIEEHSICTVPWDDCGSYIRFSVTFEAKGEKEENRIMNELKNRLSQNRWIF